MFGTRIHTHAFAMLFVLAGFSAAQQAPPPAPTAPREDRGGADGPGILDSRVDGLLRQWCDRTGDIKSLYAEFTRTIVDRVWKTTEVDEGSARYLHPNRARLDIKSGDRAESHVLTDQNEMWIFQPPLRKIKIFKLPPNTARQDGDPESPLPFLFGTKPEKAKARYRFEILEETPKSVHVKIHPKMKADQSEFVWCEVWLNRENFLPDRITILETNNNEMTYTFKGIWTNIEIDPNDFVPKRVQGWEVEVQVVRDEDPNAPPPSPAPQR